MRTTLHVTADLLSVSRTDLAREHLAAAERVGFFHARCANAGAEGWFIYPFCYRPVLDNQYVPDGTVGARISGDEIRKQMAVSLAENTCVIHAHLHDHLGRPTPSTVDRRAYLPLLKSFQNAMPSRPHGAVILSRNSIIGFVLVPGAASLVSVDKFTVLGRPMGFFGSQGALYA